MKTRQRQRFQNRADLIDAIDTAQFRLAMAIKKCGQHDAERERLKLELVPLGALELKQMTEAQRVVWHTKDRQRRHHEEQGDALLRSMPGLRGRIERLKEALGKLDTEVFDFMGEDRSVQA